MNNQNMMLSRDGRAAAKPAIRDGPVSAMPPGFENGAGMLRRDAAMPVQPADMRPEPAGAPEKPLLEDGIPEPAVSAPERNFALKPPEQAAKPAVPVGQKAAPVAPKQAAQAPKQPEAARPVACASSPDDLCRAYMDMFRSTLGLDLSAAICYENMRRICEIDVKDPCGTLYFLENTYRLSTLLYLADNLPITFVASVLAEKNRKNILKYVTIEVENGSKPYQDLLDLRRRRWMRKFENMAVNDAMTVTPGATAPTPELSAKLAAMLSDTSMKLKRFNNELTSIVAKFDDGARNDVTYIYSNWWYFLQGFENVPEMRQYVMAVTDDTRRNLKI